MKKLILTLALASTGATASEVECLASAVYSEARGEPETGQRAVIHTALNRKKRTRMHLCEIVRRWYTTKAPKKEDRKRFMRLARAGLSGQLPNPIGKREFFDSAKRARRGAVSIVKIGAHKFYNLREKK